MQWRPQERVQDDNHRPEEITADEGVVQSSCRIWPIATSILDSVKELDPNETINYVPPRQDE